MAVASERSFTKAATVLGISQPAVSQNISELERELDIKLFDRLRGEVAITPQGLVFQQHASRILSSYEDMNMVFCNPRIKNRTVPLRLFISPLLAGMVQERLIEQIGILRPGLTVELVDSAGAAHVSVIGVAEKKGADLSIKVNVLSDDILLAGFFRQMIEISL